MNRRPRIYYTESQKSLMWDRWQKGRYPEAKELKQRLRGWIAPEKDLAHSDRR